MWGWRDRSGWKTSPWRRAEVGVPGPRGTWAVSVAHVSASAGHTRPGPARPPGGAGQGKQLGDKDSETLGLSILSAGEEGDRASELAAQPGLEEGDHRTLPSDPLPNLNYLFSCGGSSHAPLPRAAGHQRFGRWWHPGPLPSSHTTLGWSKRGITSYILHNLPVR